MLNCHCDVTWYLRLFWHEKILNIILHIKNVKRVHLLILKIFFEILSIMISKFIIFLCKIKVSHVSIFSYIPIADLQFAIMFTK